jgi:hypothetical protein
MEGAWIQGSLCPWKSISVGGAGAECALTSRLEVILWDDLLEPAPGFGCQKGYAVSGNPTVARNRSCEKCGSHLSPERFFSWSSLF